jgi:hypothetical protein
MIDSWKTFLQSQGAVIEGATVRHFGNPDAAFAAGRAGSIVADLSHLGVLAVRGEDSVSFLQGQLTNDVRALDANTAQWSGICTPKGRLLGNFLMWRKGDDILLQMSADILPAIHKRLAMFVLRSRVTLRDASDEAVRLVVAGPDAPQAVAAATGCLPDDAMKTALGPAAQVVRVGADKFVLVLAPDAAPQIWQTLVGTVTPVGAQVWDGLRLRAGIPMITAATQDQFVPQMVNLEVIGGVSFQKGCYTGQEIVARSQYLGKLKRRMYRFHSDAPAQAGDSVFSPDLADQAAGMVVNAAPAPEGGYDLLAVVRVESAQAGDLHLNAPDGPRLRRESLPYAVPE